MATQKDFKVKNGLIVGGGDVSVSSGSVSISDQISGDTGQISISNGQNGDSFTRIGITGSGTADSYIRTHSNLDFHIGQSATSTTPSVSIDTSGAITSANIDVTGASGGNGQITVARTSGSTVAIQSQSARGLIGTSTNHPFRLMSNGTQRIELDTSGNFNLLSGALEINGTTVIDTSRNFINSSSIANNLSSVDYSGVMYDSKTITTQTSFSSNALTYGSDLADIVIERRHSSSKDSVLGLAGSLIDLRLNNTSGDSWSAAHIIGVGDPEGGSGYKGGLVFATGGGGTNNPTGRRTKGVAPTARILIGATGNVRILTGSLYMGSTELITNAGNLTNIGTISNSAFTIPNSIGSAGQVLKVPSSGTTLEWGNDTGLITSITNFADNRVLTASGSTTINGETNLTFLDTSGYTDLKINGSTLGGLDPALILRDTASGSVVSTLILTQDVGTTKFISKTGTSNGAFQFIGDNGTSTTTYGGFDASGNFEIGTTDVISNTRNFTANSRYTFGANSHYFESGTNSVAFKNGSGSSYFVSNNTTFYLNTNLQVSNGTFTGYVGDNSSVVGGDSDDFVISSNQRLVLGSIGYGRIYIDGSDINVSGNLEINGTQVITSSRNLVNIGTISSGAITSSGNIAISAGNKIQLSGSGDQTHHIYHNSSTDYDTVNYSTGFKLEHYQNGTQFTMDGATGNTTFTGTISSGAITSSGALTGNRVNITDATAPYITFTEGSNTVYMGLDGGNFWIRQNGLAGGDEIKINSDGTLQVNHQSTFADHISLSRGGGQFITKNNNSHYVLISGGNSGDSGQIILGGGTNGTYTGNFIVRTGTTSTGIALTIDSSQNATFSSDVVVTGDLTVNGTTTTLNTQTLDVEDKNITLNYSTGDSSASADGAGLTIQDAVSVGNDATILWDSTNDQFDFSHVITLPDSQSMKFGDSGDLSIEHNGTTSSIINYTGNFYITNTADDKDIIFETDDGSGGVTQYLTLDGSATNIKLHKNLTAYDNVQVQLGTSADLRIYHSDGNGFIHNNTGTLYIENDLTDGDIVFRSDNGSGGFANYLTIDGGNVQMIASQKLAFEDNVRATFGASSDLSIYHDGSNSYIQDSGTGNLRIAGQSVDILNPDANEFKARFLDNGAVELHYDNSKKFETTASGIQIQGSVATTTAVYSPIYYGGSVSLQLKSNTGELFAQFTNNGASELYYDNVKKFETTSGGVSVGGDITVGDSHYIGNQDPYDNLLLLSSTNENIVMASYGDIYLNTNATSTSSVGNTRVQITSTGTLLYNGTQIIDGARNFTNIGSISANDLLTQNNVSLASHGLVDLVTIGSGSRAGAIKINDVAGANYSIAAGGYDLTFYKNVSGTSNLQVMQFVGDSASDSTPDVKITNNAIIGENITLEDATSGVVRSQENLVGVPLEDGLTYFAFNHNTSTHPSSESAFDTMERTEITSFKDIGTWDNSSAFSTSEGGSGTYYLAEFHGYLLISTAGDYRFGLNSDDASDMYIDGIRVADDYGGHGATGFFNDSSPTSIYLTVGYHKLFARFEQVTGGHSIQLGWNGGSGTTLVAIPSANLYHNSSDLTKAYNGTTYTEGNLSLYGAINTTGNITITSTYPKLSFVDTDNNPDISIIGGSGQIAFYDETNSGYVYQYISGQHNFNAKNLTNIGTISSDAITSTTSGGSTTSPNVVLTVQANTSSTITTGGGTAIKFKGVSSGGNIQNYDQAMISSLGQATNNAHGLDFYIKPNAQTALTKALTITSGKVLNSVGGYQVNGTSVVDSSRNLTNIGTISSGAITSGGKLKVNQAGTGTSNQPSAVAEFSGQNSGSVLRALSLVNSTTATSGQGTELAFHNASNYAPTGTVRVRQIGDSITDSKMEFQIYRTGLHTALSIDHDSHVNIEQGDLKINGTTVIDSSRNLKNLSFIDATGDGNSGTGSQVIKLRNPNDSAYTADALTAYNATTSWDISDRVTLSQSSRAKKGSIHTYLSEQSSEAVAYERFVQLNNSNANSTYGMRSMHFYQYDGAGTSGSDMRKPSGKLLTVHTYEAGTVQEQLSLDSDGDFSVAGTISSAYFNSSSNINATGVAGFTVGGGRIGFDQSGTRSWTMGASSGYLSVFSGDGNGDLNLANNIGLRQNGTLVLDSSRNLTNIGTISNTGTHTITADSNAILMQTASNSSSYYAYISSNYNYTQSFSIRAKGGGNEYTIMDWGDGQGLEFHGGSTQKIKFSSHNLQNIGTISSGSVTATSNQYQLRLMRTDDTGDDWRFYSWTSGLNIFPSDETSTVWFGRDGHATDVSVYNGNLKIGTTTVIDSSRNLTNIGTISSGAITSSGDMLLNSGNTFTDLNIKSDRTSGNIGGVNFVNSSDVIKGQIYGHTDGTVRISTGGSNVALTLDASQNSTFAGTISSGAITCGGIHTSAGLTFGQPDHFLGDEGGQNDSETLLLRNGASASGNSGIKILAGYNDGGDTSGKIQLYTNGSTTSPKLEIDIDGNIKMGSTQIISNGRNLTNIGTISSGAITSSTSSAQNLDFILNNTTSGTSNRVRIKTTASSQQWDIENDQNLSIFKIRNATNSRDVFLLNNNAPANALSINSTGATFAGTITVGDGHTIGNDVNDNLLIAGSTGENIIIDSADDIIFDANGGDFIFKNNGVEQGRLSGDNLEVEDITLSGQIKSGDIQGDSAIIDVASSPSRIRFGALADDDIQVQIVGFGGSSDLTFDDGEATYTGSHGRLLNFSTGAIEGSIGSRSESSYNLFMEASTGTNAVGFKVMTAFGSHYISPSQDQGATADNMLRLGFSTNRYKELYAVDGSINTSDRNEKQDIQELSDAEQRVATACKGLIRRYKWNHAVEEKGDDARYHFGIIAQDLKDAFTTEGLDAGDYGMFISDTWTDDDGVEQTRLGVRYNELLAFIIATL